METLQIMNMLPTDESAFLSLEKQALLDQTAKLDQSELLLSNNFGLNSLITVQAKAVC